MRDFFGVFLSALLEDFFWLLLSLLGFGAFLLVLLNFLV
jgi:hypothetical protein